MDNESRALLRSIARAIRRIYIEPNPIKGEPITHDKSENETNNVKTPQPPSGPLLVEPQPPVAIATQAKPKKQKTIWGKIAKHGAFPVEVVTLLVLGWYACTTRDLWKEAHEQGIVIQKQMQLAERPWIAIKKIAITKVDMSDIHNPSLTLEYEVLNYGHQVAALYNIYAELSVLSSEYGSPDSYKRICDETIHGKNSATNWNGSYGVLPNGQSPFIYQDRPRLAVEDAGQRYRLIVRGCAFYQSRTDEPRWHHTPFSGEIALIKPDGTCPAQNEAESDQSVRVKFLKGLTERDICSPYVAIYAPPGRPVD